MSLPGAFSGVPPRLLWLRGVLLLAVFTGLLASLNLWLNTRLFPRIPVAPWFPAWPGPWDAVFLALFLLTLVAAVWFYRPAVGLFLVGALFLYGGDQNRGQPWMYLYVVLLLLTLFPEKPGMAGCRIVLSALYVWTGLQKCGPQFQAVIVPYMTQPVANWLPAGGVTLVKWTIMAAPAVEIFIGIGLWVPRLRRVALFLVILVHGTALLLLGPWGHNYNLVVWPWNLAMVALVLVLFPVAHWQAEWQALRRSIGALTVTALVILLPVLSYFGRWDSYFSFALYSGNLAKADLFIVPSMVPRLPEPMRRFARPLLPHVVAAYPGLEGLLIFDLQSWGMAEMGVPPIPEPRGYRVSAKAVAQFADQPTDVQLLITPRHGPVQVYRAGDLR